MSDLNVELKAVAKNRLNVWMNFRICCLSECDTKPKNKVSNKTKVWVFVSVIDLLFFKNEQ